MFLAIISLNFVFLGLVVPVFNREMCRCMLGEELGLARSLNDEEGCLLGKGRDLAISAFVEFGEICNGWSEKRGYKSKREKY